ncbi:hypothetical protein ABZP36_021325 [Zizania latifolia]
MCAAGEVIIEFGGGASCFAHIPLAKQVFATQGPAVDRRCDDPNIFRYIPVFGSRRLTLPRKAQEPPCVPLPVAAAVAALWGAPPAAAAGTACKAWLVQSIPTDMPHLRRVPGVLSTGNHSLRLFRERMCVLADVLQWLSGNATKNLGILAQYWQFLAQRKNPKSGDCGCSESDMVRLGAEEGHRVYEALEKAVDHLKNILGVDQLVYVSQLSFDKFQADEQGWVDIIKSVKPGLQTGNTGLSWFVDAKWVKGNILKECNCESVTILVADWTHFIPNTENYLKSILYSNILCTSSKYNHCIGKVEIKYYVVPGYNETGNCYPDFTQVNHGNYAVSDVRANIGTSNLIWDYFYTTAGVSFGTYNLAIVSQLQDIFDADWYSPYTVPVKPPEESALDQVIISVVLFHLLPIKNITGVGWTVAKKHPTCDHTHQQL